MPILGIFNVKPQISGSWNCSPTARPWAEIKECGRAAGRWGFNKKPFLWAQLDELGKGSGRKGGRASQRGKQQKRHFFSFSLRGPIPPVFQPILSTIHWEAPFFSSLLSQDADSLHVLLPERTLPQPPAPGPSLAQLAEFWCFLPSFWSSSALVVSSSSRPKTRSLRLKRSSQRMGTDTGLFPFLFSLLFCSLGEDTVRVREEKPVSFLLICLLFLYRPNNLRIILTLYLNTKNQRESHHFPLQNFRCLRYRFISVWTWQASPGEWF